MRQLARFNISVRDTDFLLEITDDAGDVTELSATADQLDILIDALNDLVGDDIEEDEGDDGARH